ncbi:nucleoside/nucleotide kinase family protein [Amnibacterium flavum]|uniref:Nucleoside/nucleotide kinase family protein n=1 Tax=Amnibacterium flavum TaxID=2173173 RepID=A0A2V1HUG9_9MICO|nr:nucleoside/nucleotide kinase family protein [Amnibacterium flavum]PVZ95951.1 nucleoside/nucleotide kinase family protein [Amnibacterium flavum]
MSSAEYVVDRAVALAAKGERVLLGIAGAPGAGKTTLAVWLVDRLSARGVVAAHVPMDGFHLGDAVLDRLGLSERKGAIDTFDPSGYLALLRRLRAETGGTVFAPAFEREIEQPIAASIPVDPSVRIVVSEGNYLLSPLDPWPSVRREFDEVWFADVDHEQRRQRLRARHERYGKTAEQAAEFVLRVDEANARVILGTREHADLFVDVDAVVG